MARSGRFTPEGLPSGLIPGPSSGGSPALRLAVLCQLEDSAVAGRRHQSGGWGANRPGLTLVKAARGIQPLRELP